MFISTRATKIVSLIAASLALMALLACASDEPAVPAGPSAEEIAKIVSDSVNASVSQAVADAVPEGTSAQEIQRMVEAAVSASSQPGITRAEVEAAVTASVQSASAGQLTAAEVQRIVDASVKALPAPEAPQIDISAIRGLVQQAVTDSVPEGVSADEIAKLVEAAVGASTAGVPTRDELTKSIEAAVKGAAAGQLTAADVQKIVDASVGAVVEEATTKAITEAQKALAQLPELRAGERPGFSRVVLPELERPTNIPKNITLAPKQELTYVYAVPERPGVVPPMQAANNDLYDIYMWVFMPAFVLGSVENDFGLRQGWATGYSVSDDGLTYLLHINPDAIFQDGTPITAKAAKDTWEWGMSAENQPVWRSIGRHMGFIEGMKAVEAGEAKTASGLEVVDDVTLAMKLVDPLPTFPLRLSIWLTGMFKAEQAVNDPEGFRLNPIGVGPYRASYDDATAVRTYTATENWWGAAPGIKVVRLPTVPDLQVNYIMYEAGEADAMFADSGRQPALWDPEHKFHGDLKPRGGAESPSLWFMEFKTDHPPFDDINVRKAFAHAVDMENIVPAVLGAMVKAGAGIIVEGNACWQPGTGYDYDPAKARQFLKDSRYGGPEGVPSITVEVGRPAIIRVLEVLQEQWKDNLGIEINLVRLEPGQQRQPVTEFARRSGGQRIPNPSHLLVNLADAPVLQQGGINAMIKPALSMPLDDPNYCEVWNEIERFIIDAYTFLPLQGGDFASWAVQPWVFGYETTFGDAFLTLPWWVIGTRDRSLYE